LSEFCYPIGVMRAPSQQRFVSEELILAHFSIHCTDSRFS
jgi:hypothetical protein